jgi:hypothetical protein
MSYRFLLQSYKNYLNYANILAIIFHVFLEIILEQEKGATVSRLQEHRGAPFVCFHL